MSGIGSARVRSVAGTKRAMRFIALTRAAAAHLPIDAAREIARTLLSCVEYGAELTGEIIASAVLRRRAFGYFPDATAASAAEAIFDAWRSVAA